MRSKRRIARAITAALMVATGTILAGFGQPAAAAHSTYCGHGIGPSYKYHNGQEYRAVYISARDTTYAHIHKYANQQFWNTAWHTVNTYERTCLY